MKQVLILLILIPTIFSYAFNDCGSTSFIPTYVTITPNPVARGHSFTTTLTGAANTNITSGVINLRIYLEDEQIYSKTFDICNLGTCSLIEGKIISIDYSNIISKFEPPGYYHIYLTMSDYNTIDPHVITCTNFTVNLY